MEEAYRFEKVYRKFSDRLLKEVKPFLSGEPQIWRKRVAPEGSVLKQTGQKLRAAIPVLGGELRCDVLVFHDLPTEQGLVHVVHSYAHKILLPPEYLLVMDGRIPRAALLTRGTLDEGVWVSAIGDEDRGDDFCVFVKNIKRGKGLRARRLSYEAEWVQEGGGNKLKLDWAMQLAPLGEERFVFVFRLPYQKGLFGTSKLGVEKFLTVAEWLRESIQEYDYVGEAPKRGVLQPTLALLALPGIRPDSVPEVTGEELGE
jgi:hypothetical protein